MFGQHETRTVVVNPYPVEIRALRISLIATVQQNDGNIRLAKLGNDGLVFQVFSVRIFERSKENSGNLLRNKLLAQFRRGFLMAALIRNGMAPHQRVRSCLGRAHDPLADGLENLCAA